MNLTLSIFGAFLPLIGLIAAIILDRERRKKTEKAPQSEKLLRPPGYSLFLRQNENEEKAVDELLTTCGFSTIAGILGWLLVTLLSIHAPILYLSGSALAVALCFMMASLSARRVFKRYQDAVNIRLGLRGEQAVAEALNEAAESGFRSFHDLQTDKVGNIDHVTVGARGVFSIETKARHRRASRSRQAAHEVIFDGASLQFPSHKETKPIEQARRNAAWLANYLKNKTGEPVRVEPVVVLPGWFVRISEKGNFPVRAMNANYLIRFLKGQPEIIPPAQVRRIITALDEKCRDVEF